MVINIKNLATFQFKGNIIRPDDGPFEPKHVAELLILITIYIVVLLTGINYYIIAIHNRMGHIKKCTIRF